MLLRFVKSVNTHFKIIIFIAVLHNAATNPRYGRSGHVQLGSALLVLTALALIACYSNNYTNIEENL